MTNVVHLKREPFDIPIDRSSRWGNPWSHKDGTLATFKVDTIEEAVENYRKWLKGEDFIDFMQVRREWILDNLGTLRNKTLG